MKEEIYIQRCFDLARLGLGHTAPNPVVGAVLVADDRIIGEGFHQRYGQAHAEVNALAAVKPADRPLIGRSTLYVSLEPCSVFGKTPPCTDLILRHQIPRVVISQRDRSPGVNGRGVGLLRAAGVEVTENVLPEKGYRLSAPRNTFVTCHRPYIILKYARTPNGWMARQDRIPFWITNPLSRRLTHRWRAQVDGIMVGTETALRDNPELTTRLYPGDSPLRIVLDRTLRLPPGLHIFDGQAPTLLITEKTITDDPERQLRGFQVGFQRDLLPRLLTHLHDLNILQLMVEGGPTLLNRFIAEDLWDEARVFTGREELENGIPAPVLPRPFSETHFIGSDRLDVYYAKRQSSSLVSG